MSDQDIKEKIEGYLALVESGEDENDVNDTICDFCSSIGDRAWDIKQQVEIERV